MLDRSNAGETRWTRELLVGLLLVAASLLCLVEGSDDLQAAATLAEATRGLWICGAGLLCLALGVVITGMSDAGSKARDEQKRAWESWRAWRRSRF